MENELDLTRVPKEVLFILELLKEDNAEFLLKNQEKLCSDIQWDLFLKYAMHHRVFPLLYSKIKMFDKEIIPDAVVQYLTEKYKSNTFRMLQLTAEMERISENFIKSGINVLFLKGPVIANLLYGDISLRTSKDLDFIISIKHLKEAEILLIKQGYEKKDSQFKFNKLRHRHISFFHPQKRIEVEIHWRLHPSPEKETKFSELWNRKRRSSLNKNPVYYLGDEDLFHYLILHGARHGWNRLRWLIDIQQLCKKQLDWNQLYLTAKLRKGEHLVGHTLILLSELLNVKITEEMKLFTIGDKTRYIAQRAIHFIENPIDLQKDVEVEREKNYTFKYLLSLKSTPIQKSIFILSYLLPSQNDAKTLKLNPKIHFLYFMLRPFLILWRKFNF